MLTLTRSRFVQIFVTLSVLLSSSIALAEDSAMREYRDFSKETPSATMDFQLKSLKVLAGGTWGDGVLHYQGQDYPLELAAASAGASLGYKAFEGTANVYGLKALEDFPGVYGGGGAGGTIGTAGGKRATLENSKGVVLMMTSMKSKGAVIAVDLGGLHVKFDD